MNCVERISHYTAAVPPEESVLPAAAAASAAAGEGPLRPPPPPSPPCLTAVDHFDRLTVSVLGPGLTAAGGVGLGRGGAVRLRPFVCWRFWSGNSFLLLFRPPFGQFSTVSGDLTAFWAGSAF